MRKILALLLLLFVVFGANAQLSLHGYIDVGKNNASSGVFFRPAVITSYERYNFKLQSGFLWTLPSQNDNGVAAWEVCLMRSFHIKKAKFEGGMFYRHQPFSNLVREHNWGVLLGFNSKHFRMRLGNNSRTFKFTSKGINELGLTEDDDVKISEPRNLMYAFTYYVKPYEHRWNIAISITDYDHFLIQQETNPMIMGSFTHDLPHKMKIYSEVWYQSAGLLNLQVNYFGFNFRTGVLWQM